MRVAVISDIHGNCLGLDAVLADLARDPVEQLVCLGDAIQGGPQPAQTVARLRAVGCPVVMGNADAWLLSGVPTGTAETVSDQQRETRTWSLAQLSAADRAFIAAFQPTVELPLDGGRSLLCFHGSPHSFDDILLPDSPVEDFLRLLGAFAPRIMTGGHTHVQYVRRLGMTDTVFFNPGSVGLAYSHHQPDDDFRADPWAEYAVLSADGGRRALEFRRVPLERAALIQAITESGMPYAAAVAARYAPRAGAE